MIDMTIPTDSNMSAKEFNKLSKHNNLQIEIKRMCHLKTSIVPVVIGALGLLNKNVCSHIKKLPRKPSLQELQKIVLNSVVYLLRKALWIRFTCFV